MSKGWFVYIFSLFLSERELINMQKQSDSKRLFCLASDGKGTFLNTIQRISNDYAVVSSMEAFVESKSYRHPTDLAMLRGARLVLSQETEQGRAWGESKIKSLTGGDPNTARYMIRIFLIINQNLRY